MAETFARRDRDQAPGGAFLDEVAHQLRSPLAPLLMLSHLVADSPELPESLRPHLTLMRENVERIARMIDDLADIGRLRAGTLGIDREEVDLAALIVEAVATRRDDAAERRVRLEASLADDLPSIRGDGPRLRRLLDTLLANAVVHSAAGSTVTIHSSASDGFAAVVISDRGRGIAPHALATLFSADQAGRSRISTHLGVGLAVGHAVASLHRGSLEAHSEGPGAGAEFTLRLPTGP